MSRTIKILDHEQLIDQTVEENVQTTTGMTNGIMLTFANAPAPCGAFEVLITKEELETMLKELS